MAARTSQLKTLSLHSHLKPVIAITPDGKKAVWNSDRTLNLWDLETGKKLKTLIGHTCTINAVAITSDAKRAVSTSLDETLKVWDLETGMMIASVTGDDDLRTCALAPDGVTIVAGEDSGRVLFLRLEGV